MNPGDMHELERLHRRRRLLLTRKRSDEQLDADAAEFQWLRERIDAPEMDMYYGLQYERNELILLLRVRRLCLLLQRR